MPDIVTLRAAKFWVGLLGAVLTAITAATPDYPAWFKAALAVATGVGVYITPNADPVEPGPAHVEETLDA